MDPQPRLAEADRPTVLADTDDLVRELSSAAPGAAWRLDQEPRDLDSNLVALPAGGSIETHEGPELDVLVHVVAGSGTLHAEGEDLPLVPGRILWLPKTSRRGFTAGPDGLAWLTVHRRKPGLSIGRR